MPGLTIRSRTKRYRETVLDGIDLDLAPATVTTIAGPNGSGKTTPLACVLGLVRYSGTIRLAGTPIHHRPRRVAAAFDDSPLYSTLTGYENLRYLSGTSAGFDEVAAAVEGLIDAGLLLRRRASTYSYGQAKRLTLAAVHLSQAPLVILDEPSKASMTTRWVGCGS